MNSQLSSLQRLKNSRELDSKEFPLSALLTLYSRNPKLLYLNWFEGMQELIQWLSPISRSTKQPIYIPIYFCTYEINEIAKLLNEHPSKIYQELMEIYSNELNTET